jgi:hypothetical protein
MSNQVFSALNEKVLLRLFQKRLCRTCSNLKYRNVHMYVRTYVHVTNEHYKVGNKVKTYTGSQGDSLITQNVAQELIFL